MKKIICALAAASFLIVNSQAAMAAPLSIGQGQITYGDPTGKGVYLGENMYLQKDSVTPDGEAPGNSKVFDAEYLSSVQTIAIGPISYEPQAKEPTWGETMTMIDKAALENFKNENVKLLTYEEVSDKILRETGNDLNSMNPRQAAKVYKQYISRYADAYATVTVINGSKDLSFWLELNKSVDGKLLYNYKEAVAGYNGRVVKTYENASKNVVRAIEVGYKKAIKELSDKQKKGLQWDLN